jgi:putative ABC transport system permease protein
VLQDIRYALRLLRRSPAFTADAVSMLALGIGATTAIYSVVYGILLRPLPVNDEGSLLVAYATYAGVRDDALISYPRFKEWRGSGAFEDLAALSRTRLDLIGGPAAERVEAAQVSDNFFTVLGVQAALGRVFTTADRAASETPAVISDALWRRRFGGDPAIVGRRLTASDLQVVVIGVMPRRFERWRLEAHIWVPIERGTLASVLGRRGYLLCTPIGRLAQGRSAAMPSRGSTWWTERAHAESMPNHLPTATEAVCDWSACVTMSCLRSSSV